MKPKDSAIATRPAVWMRKADKKKLILDMMDVLYESGVGAPTGLHIADRCGYTYSGSFRDLLWEMVDENLLKADQENYRGGMVEIRWRFYLPETFRVKQTLKKMRARDRREMKLP